MTPSECYLAGNLSGAIDAALATVRSKPTDTVNRYFLCELLCFAGDLDRTDKHLDAIMQQDAELTPTVVLTRQLVRAETSRKECFQSGRLPEFVAEPTPAIRKHLDALIAIREGNNQEAADLLATVDEDRPQISVQYNGKTCDSIRDMDDTTASFLEVLTCNGTYYWIPFERIASLEVHKPERPIDLIWRRSEISVVDGPEGEVYIPAIYWGTSDSSEDGLKLGRQTTWTEDEHQPVRGRGRRMFLVGDESADVMQLERLEIATA